jgi:uncharacterized protein
MPSSRVWQKRNWANTNKMKKKEIIKKIEAEAKGYFEGASGCHDWSHVERVRSLALHIGKEENADLFLLEIAALLHDIGRKEEMKQKGKFCHADKGAELAVGILRKYDLSADAIENIRQAIVSHSYRKSLSPQSIEAKVLYDADKLDSIGAIGIARICFFAGNAGSNKIYTGNEKRIAQSKKSHSYTAEDTPYLEYEVKLKYVKDKMFTRIGKLLAKERHEFMKKYFERMWEEVRGEA